jgi:1-acyl-sn-glycerol-3-phosphate acyltransferase
LISVCYFERNLFPRKPGEDLNLRRSHLLYFLIRSLGYFIFRLFYRLEIEGRENIPAEGPAIILPKHQFWSDVPIVGIALWRPASYIAKQELFAYPVIRQFITLLGGVPIDRLKPVKSLDSFRYVERLLKEGDFIVLYPEGTYYPRGMGRGKHRFIGRFLDFQEKNGRRAGKPIPFIPMGIQFGEGWLRSPVKVKIGRPLFAREGEETLLFTDRIMEQIAGLSGLAPLKTERAAAGAK